MNNLLATTWAPKNRLRQSQSHGLLKEQEQNQVNPQQLYQLLLLNANIKSQK